ncbi:long-chain fatty acid--CoA ligase [Sporosarcina sp. ACRSL]|uniref:class I adenylate-forming enzyme family protein n=1 Tax=Sporosarcina sp. ACRSL TaxID=2918215 RepID=UPI001EF3E067|nr:long-chain fatty acid--CoA ligase [Sporosarcina sp. ACRSL]MCG7344250.1 long-chain fatty acid--CoA ligase [Sporosarcina sp. ACRSL]
MFMTEVLGEYAKSQPDKVFTSFNGKEWTYGEFYESAKKVAGHFQAKGYQKGDIIALYSLNSDLFLVCYFGIQLGGYIVMPVNTKLAPPEVEYIFNHSVAKALIYDKRLEDVVQQSKHPFNERLSIQDDIESFLTGHEENYEPAIVDGEDVAVVMYTSGTTGKPKGVMLTHQNLLSTAEIWSEAMSITDSDRMLISTPLFHCAACHVFMIPVTYKGGTVIIEEAFSPKGTIELIQKTGPTIFFGVPGMYTIILNLPEIKNVDLSSLRLFCYGAAPMPYEMVKKLKETFPNVKVQNLYGQTENSPAASTLKDHLALEKIGSVGEPLPQTEIQVVNEFGEPLPTGQVGEIVMRGPQVMKGYLKNKEETRRTIKNGWLYTGDLGRMDEDGLLYIVDRKKDMIIRGGENVYPVEVEEVLYQIPGLFEAAVVGIPHEVLGEVPKAYIVVKEGATLTREDVISHCSSNLAKYKIPAEIEFLDELPRNASGKVLKHTLRASVHSTTT